MFNRASMENNVSVSPSLWDTAVLIGTPPLGGRATSSMMTFLLFLNAFLQISLILVLADEKGGLTSPPISSDDLAELHVWRQNIAHDYKHYDPIKRMSLTSRVCLQDPSLVNAGSQLAMYTELKTYLGKYQDNGFLQSPGIQMCVFAVFLWILTIGYDLNDSVAMCRAIWAIPGDHILRRHTTIGSVVMVRGEEKDAHVVLSSISVRRRWFALIVQGTRIGVGITLRYLTVHEFYEAVCGLPE